MWRAVSAPTSLADIDGASVHYLQVITRNATPATSTYLKTGTANLGTLSVEALASSSKVNYSVGTDSDGYGGGMSRHDGGGTSKALTNNTSFAAGSGSFYVALGWCKSTATAASEEVISLKLEAEFTQ